MKSELENALRAEKTRLKALANNYIRSAFAAQKEGDALIVMQLHVWSVQVQYEMLLEVLCKNKAIQEDEAMRTLIGRMKEFTSTLARMHNLIVDKDGKVIDLNPGRKSN